jgi:hypothetical protein
MLERSILPNQPTYQPLTSCTITAEPHEFLFIYCGTNLIAIRHRDWKAHWATTIWEQGLDHCPTHTLCGCDGSGVVQHSPPLLFNLDRDPNESDPLSPSSAEYTQVMQAILKARESHLLSIQSDVRPSRIETLALPQLMPCCNFPTCTCQEAVVPQIDQWFARN